LKVKETVGNLSEIRSSSCMWSLELLSEPSLREESLGANAIGGS
jgi:hypothetical protein